ncbi:G-type lectin S-receptor-like serine/threonine-protein kinase At4g27290 isoform X2 [Rhododendron vialii]|uniref:G-type lectin S-receptor-like serine/threonine-protein kinase At4g27290 isoform X2 n=1 Tax=Rhododendron vialii TaxID=182163 RepID=UPI00265EDB66|nr:G-type lectin S-receptor-like serine/threonine-protein kinase At4g27290 isoform X2 [Rhododendron vialii]
METIPFILFCSLISFSLLESSSAVDTLSPNQSLISGGTLVSSGQTFVLGFFSPNGSKSWFLGIWYKSYPEIVVWVANREKPIQDSNGTLIINSRGNLVLLNGSNSIIWSSNSSRSVQNSVARLLDSGNLVLTDKSDTGTENYTWQSFDYPSDTLLAGMKFGWDSNSGLDRYLTSWKDASDPSPGDFTYRLDIGGLPQFSLRRGSEKKYRSGPWNGVQFSGSGIKSTAVSIPSFLNEPDEVYYIYEAKGVLTRFMVNNTGLLQRFVLNKGSSKWALMFTLQNDLCDNYGHCGVNGICKINKAPICECLQGFVPQSQNEWGIFDWSSGCVRRIPLDCQKGEGFIKVKNVKLPDLLEFRVDTSMKTKECRAECLKNCSCTAYATLDSSGSGSGCLMWFDVLLDIRKLAQENVQQDSIYVRMPASELDLNQKNVLVIIVVVSAVCGMLFLSLLCWWIFWKRGKKISLEPEKEDIELPLFDLITISTATNNFSNNHKIGEGGFGHVYKGKLSIGQEIAVKRLSKSSGQGLQEFKNEVLLISKLQHRNLVRLLGCCIEGEERMLIYEYMPNKSLDDFIFDHNKRKLLQWPKRFEITMGIARGILYLHQDSRLRIIHRDLKTSNILLDCELNPKISDFGIARIFSGDQVEAKTKRVIGTYGYMSPEYAIDGKFSVKSDVFSLGVLLLEIVSGQKNRKFHHSDHHHTLLGHAWLLWKEDKALELMDSCLEDSYVQFQVLRCIQVGLLCVQKLPEDRPAMPAVVFMLGNEGVTLPQPKQPGFFVERSSADLDTSTEGTYYTQNDITITLPEAR